MRPLHRQEKRNPRCRPEGAALQKKMLTQEHSEESLCHEERRVTLEHWQECLCHEGKPKIRQGEIVWTWGPAVLDPYEDGEKGKPKSTDRSVCATRFGRIAVSGGVGRRSLGVGRRKKVGVGRRRW